ncbi:MAG: stage III sporulation protein AF [Lachnospiraceae bacterium]|nr:stage III sporulation protein AF [Lachnospiraceae bacterium]
MEEIYAWVENIAFYSLLMMVVLHVLPAGDQKKYVQFFMGLVFILVIAGPILRLAGWEQELTDTYLHATYDQELEEFLKEQERLEKNLEIYTREVLQEAREKGEAEHGAAEDGTGEERGGEGSGEEVPGQLVEPVEIHID